MVDQMIRTAQTGVPITDVYPMEVEEGGPDGDGERDEGVRRRSIPTAEERSPSEPPSGRRPRAYVRPRTLSETERQDIVRTFVTLLEGLYVHLPLKRAMYATDPIQRLRLLAQRSSLLSEEAFHYEVARILGGLRDAHTRYVGPESLAGRVARLPFLVEAFGPPDAPCYIVSTVTSEETEAVDPHFVRGVQLKWWNAVPIDRAVDRHAEAAAGARPDRRRSLALASLTLRPLQFGPPPDEYWVVVGYLDLDGVERETRFDWRVVTPGQPPAAAEIPKPAARALALDAAAEISRQTKKLLFAPARWEADQGPAERRTARARAAPSDPNVLGTAFSDTVSASAIDTPSGRFGLLRLWSFQVPDDVEFVEEIVRLLGLLPKEGLIVDLRGNPGGLIWAAERLLQLFTPDPISPTRFSLVATPLTRAMAQAPQNERDLAPWRQSLDDALATGDLYSQAIPITPLERCNDVGQVYGGPVVAVVDASTYSAGDLFAAGFHDNEIGILVTVGEATGAGGANVWMPGDVRDALLGTPFELPPLPSGIGFSLSVRRATRSGALEGTAIEDVGVRGQRRYALTRRDLVEGNADLLAFCGEILASTPRTELNVSPPAGDGPVEVETRGLDRLDFFVDGRPRGSLVASDGITPVDVGPGWQTVELVGYMGDTLHQRRFLRR